MIHHSNLVICHALRNSEVVNFAKTAIREGYNEFFKNWVKQISEMLDFAFDALVESQKLSISAQELEKASQVIACLIFKKDEPHFWFNEVYQNYKLNIRPVNDSQRIQEFILGHTLLDFGCGGGYLCLYLAQKGYKILATDVLDYRTAQAKYLPFYQMVSNIELPYFANPVDTVIIQMVLHHIDEENLPCVIRQISKIAKRIIIIEDIYDLPEKVENLQECMKSQPLLSRFVSLHKDDQFQVLALIDYFANVVALGIFEMNLPFQFRTVSEWKLLLQANGVEILREIALGFEGYRMHKTCQALLVCNSNK